jgi:hydrogenase expression/formation protein HypC
MCLAVPGKVMEISGDDPIMRTGKVNFGGIVKTINLAYVPEVEVGNYVLVHVGFALNVVDEGEALKVFEYLRELGELEELTQTEEDESNALHG